LDAILQLNRRELLHHAGSVSHEKASEKSEGELDTFRALLKSKEKEESIKEIEGFDEKD